LILSDELGLDTGIFSKTGRWDDSTLDSIKKVYKDRVGGLAELFVFHYLKKNSQTTSNPFDENCWISSARMHYFPLSDELTCQNDAGYDFVYNDKEGALGGGPAIYYIEVKGQMTESRRGTLITGHEWKVAQGFSRRAAQEEGDQKEQTKLKEVYVLAIVALTPLPPKILFWLEDPPALHAQSLLVLQPSEFFLSIGQGIGGER